MPSLPPLSNRLPALPANAPYRLAIVLPWPSEDDCRIGKPLTGSAGYLLRGVLAANGIVLDNEVAICHLSQHYLGTWEAGGWEGAEVQGGIKALVSDLTAWRPNIILGLDDPRLGAGVLHLLRNGNVAPRRTPSGYQWPTKLGKWRGSLFNANFTLWQAGAIPAITNSNRNSESLSEDSASATTAPLPPDCGASSANALSPESPCSGSGGIPLEVATSTSKEDGIQPKHDVKLNRQNQIGDRPIGDGDAVGTTVLAAEPSPLAFKCLTTYHPAYIQSVWSKAFELRQDVRRAREEARSAELTLPTTNISYGPVE